MTAIEQDYLELCQRPVSAWVTTYRPDGTAHNSIVWVDVDGVGLSFNTALGRVKEKHLRADPRVAVSVLDPDNVYHWVSVSGTATLHTEGADAQIDALAKKYLGVDTYPMRQPGEQRVTVRISPDRVIGQPTG